MTSNGVWNLRAPEYADTWTYTKLNTVKFNHKWTINNFSLCKNKPGQSLQSSTFSPDTNDQLNWYLQLYPGGRTEEHKGYISIFLWLESCNGSEVTSDYEISILNKRNEKMYRARSISTFLPGRNWGFSNYVNKKKLIKGKTNSLLPDDQLTIFCEINFVQDIVKMSGKRTSIPPFQESFSRMLDDVGLLLENHRFSDVTLTVHDKDIRAHRAILAARSPVFSAMFENDTEERKENRVIEINDIDHEVFMEMLRFIYTDKSTNLKKMAKDLLAAADKYALNTLKIMCAKVLYEDLTIENSADIFVLSNLHGVDELKMHVVDFICAHSREVIETVAFKSMVNLHPSLSIDIMCAISTRNSDESISSGKKIHKKLKRPRQ